MDCKDFPQENLHPNAYHSAQEHIDTAVEGSAFDDDQCYLDASDKLPSEVDDRSSFLGKTDTPEEESDELMNLLEGICQHASRLKSELHILHTNQNTGAKSLESSEVKPNPKLRCFKLHVDEHKHVKDCSRNALKDPNEPSRPCAASPILGTTSSFTSLVNTECVKRRRRFPLPLSRYYSKDRFGRKMLQPVVGWLRRWASTDKNNNNTVPVEIELTNVCDFVSQDSQLPTKSSAASCRKLLRKG